MLSPTDLSLRGDWPVVVVVVSKWRQSTLSLFTLPDYPLSPGSLLFAVHQLQTGVRFFSFLGEKCGIVTVGLAYDVSQEVCIQLGCARVCSRKC